MRSTSQCSFAGSFLGTWEPTSTCRTLRDIQCRSARRAAAVTCSTSVPAWISANDGVLNSILDLSTPGKARIAPNTPTVLKGTELLTLPTTVIITPQIARSTVQKAIAKGTDISQFNDECMLAVFLLIERSIGAKSQFESFIRACPAAEECNQVFLWTDEELQLLEGSPIKDKAVNLRNGITEEWEELNQFVFESKRDSFPESSFSLDDYLWAQAIVLSHCVFAGSEMPLVIAPVVSGMALPAIGEQSSCVLQYRGGGFFGKPRLVVTSSKDVDAGDALTLPSAEEMFNDSMLLEYGVVSENRLASRFDMEFSVGTLDKFFEEKECILEQEDFGVTQSFTLKSPTASGSWQVPEFMESFVRLMCLSGLDVFLLETIFEKEVWGHMALPVSAENEKAMCSCIIGACEDALEGYPVQDDSAEGPDAGDGNSKKRLANVAIAGEKAILEACKKHFVRHLSSIDTFQYYHERRLDSLDLLRPVDESEIVDSESGVRMGRAFDQNF